MKKNILLISEAYWSKSKGTANYAMKMVSNLSSLFNITLLVPIFSDCNVENAKIDDVTIIGVPVQIDSKVGLLNKKARTSYCEFVRNNIHTIVADCNIQLVHVLYGHFVIKYLPKLDGLKVIWTCHNMPPNESHPPFNKNNLISKLANSLYRLLVRFKHAYIINTAYIDAIVCISEWTKHDLNNWIFSKSKSVYVIGNGVSFTDAINEKSIRKKSEGMNLITVGGIKPHKNVHIIPEISKLLIDNNIEHKWYIIGPAVNDKYCNVLKKNIDRYSSKVIYLGEVDADALKKQYINSDLYVHTSKEEGFCLTILEAARLGLPSVATNVGAIPEIINILDSGVVCEPNITSIYTSIVKFINNRDRYSSGIDLSNTVECKFDWTLVSRYYDKLYKEYLIEV